MASDEPTTGHPFDVGMVRDLAEVMSQHDLSEVDIDTDAGRLRLRRGPRGVVTAMPTVMPAAPTGQLPAQAAPAAEKPKASKGGLEIKSEAIGIFYSRPKPDQEPYVKVGSKVTSTTVVGLIEAMKMFNEITAGISGTISEIMVENQQAVEYGTVLFRVEPS